MNQKDSIHSVLFDLIFLVQIEMKNVVKNAGEDLSPIEILVLRALVEHGELTQQQLSQRLSKDKAQITRLIKGLVNKRLIIKQLNPDDKRSFLITAKDKVKNKIVQFIGHEKQMVQKMLEGASDKEIKNMKKMLDLMKNNMKSLA